MNFHSLANFFSEDFLDGVGGGDRSTSDATLTISSPPFIGYITVSEICFLHHLLCIALPVFMNFCRSVLFRNEEVHVPIIPIGYSFGASVLYH